MAIRRVALARLLRDVTIQADQIDNRDFRTDLVSALNPALQAVRFGRTWRISRSQIQGDYLLAKLGFDMSREIENIDYDESIQDWVFKGGQRASAGLISHFVVDLDTQYLAFEYKLPNIQIQSFIGALANLLNQTQAEYGFTIEPVVDVAEFFQWLSDVDTVSTVHLSLRRPNPSFEGRPARIRQLLEETNSAKLELEAKAASDRESLVVEGTDLDTLARYAGEGYGDITARGNDGPRIRRFSSKKNVRETQITVTTGESSESIFQKILGVISGLLP